MMHRSASQGVTYSLCLAASSSGVVRRRRESFASSMFKVPCQAQEREHHGEQPQLVLVSEEGEGFLENTSSHHVD